MRLTTFTDYTLRTLLYLALVEDRLATIGDIAASYGISANHLMKVVHQLAQGGYIETVRGKNGGMRLAKPASAINLGEIVRRSEQDMGLAPCFEDSGSCAIHSCCVLERALRQARQAFLAVLDGYSLAELAAPRGHLSMVLGVGERREMRAAQAEG